MAAKKGDLGLNVIGNGSNTLEIGLWASGGLSILGQQSLPQLAMTVRRSSTS